ncbi:tyrosine-type recombinase/integrase [Lichenihabitans psoromatis]|uniref:tyrosine-type recombinase/integrase n=1 Tax=Lichenihabitans psoromatis TaxID=2528642 RepID=UPI0010367769|nr:site-specific integrase [Lichenihabitans psoromatis]
MARTVKNPKTDSRSARTKLPERREPYWTVVSAGCALGYRRGANGGTWLTRFRDETGKQHHGSLGAADDGRDPDGVTVFSFAQAQERARDFFGRKARELAGHTEPDEGPYAVAAALADYFAERERKGSKGVRADRYAADARILPPLGTVEVDRLTTKAIRAWLLSVEKAPKLLRTKQGSAVRKTADIDINDPDAGRARKATANRLLTVLKAALNFAFHEGKVASDEPWRKVKPYREADAPVIAFLSSSECVRLVYACQGSFRDLVRGALVTGCRYGELTRMHVADFNPDAGMITVRLSKSGKSRHVALADEGRQIFNSLTVGRKGRDLIFKRNDGRAWGASHQQRPLEEAAKAARLDPAPTFHVLRHTYASSLAMKGVSMRVIADQLGHADTRVTERHYARLAPSYVADVVRAALPSIGIAEMLAAGGDVTRMKLE